MEAAGFEPQTVKGVELISGQASTLNVSLKVGTAATHVNVEEAVPLLQTATATIGSEVNNQQLTELPAGSGMSGINQVGGTGLNQTNLAHDAGTLSAFPERDGYNIIPYLNVALCPP